jgi:cysteine sulfinate desulfinase/cysteine desulfurase-like protein
MGAVRFSRGRQTTGEEIDAVISQLNAAFSLRAAGAFRSTAPEDWLAFQH